MKVLFVCSGDKFGNISPIVFNQGESLRKRLQDIEYFSLNGNGIFKYIKYVFLLKKFLKQNQFDIIHAHYGLCGIISLISRRNEKCIVSYMGSDILKSNFLKFYYLNFLNIISRINIMLSNKYDWIIAKSENIADKLKNVKKLNIIPNGIDLYLFRQIDKTEAKKSLGWDDKYKYVLFLSNPLRHEKNYKLAYQSIKILNDDDIKLVTAHNIKNDELYKYYSAADCLILTSFYEGSPNVVKEAMACNCPLVSTDVGDVKWIIGKTEGCYISSFNENDFSEKMKLALNFSREFGRTNGRERLIELKLESSAIADKLFRIYKSVLNSSA